jgi:nucleotide-binding universal stress UspA family protein
MTTRLVFGEAAEQLTNLINELEPELVVTGSRGHGSFRAALTGSVSRRLMTTNVPVVVVPPEVDNSWELGSTLVCGVSEVASSEAA